MSKIAIIYFSGYGHTVKLAEAVHAGAASVGEATLYRIDQDGNLPDDAWEAIAAADAIIYGSPTYMGGPAWQFKKFADASSKPWFAQAWKDKIAAGFTNSASVNGDKYATIQYFWTLSQQHGQVWVGTGLLPSNTKARSAGHQLDRRFGRRAGDLAFRCLAGRSTAQRRPGNRQAARQARGRIGRQAQGLSRM